MVESFGLSFSKNVSVIDPIGYFEMLELEFLCKCIITDSGGVQKEAYFMKNLVSHYVIKQSGWKQVESGWNTIVGTDKNKILSVYNSCNILPKSYQVIMEVEILEKAYLKY